MDLAGLNPSHHQGALLPMMNAADLKRYLALSPEEAHWVNQQLAAVMPVTFGPNSPDWGASLDDLMKEWALALPPQPRDPLVLDLDGDGIESRSLTDGVHFNLDGIGLAEAIAWCGPDDGLLARDVDGDGRISTGNELFSNFTWGPNGKQAAHGFAALAELDSNRDGYVDTSDVSYRELHVWRDANSNAITEPGELLTLEEAGVTRLRTSFATSHHVDGNGQQHRQVGRFLGSDGREHAMSDVWFSTSPADAVDPEAALPVGASLLALPNLAGCGNVRSLHQTMARDASGDVQAALMAWQTASGTEREALLDALIFQWTGVAQLPQRQPGSVMNARRLAALEAFMGEPLPDHNRNQLDSSTTSVSKHLAAAYDHFKEAVRSRLLDQTDLKSAVNGLSLHWAVDRFEWNVAPLADRLTADFNAKPDRAEATLDVLQLLERLRAVGLTDVASAVFVELRQKNEPFAQLMRACGDGPPRMLHGSDAADHLRTFTVDGAVFLGGEGDDRMEGGPGADIVVYGRGDGHDVYSTPPSHVRRVGTDTLAFLAGINPDDVKLERVERDLVLRLSTEDTFTVRHYFRSPDERLPHIQFNDGTVWSEGEIAARLVAQGTGTRDYWTGFEHFSNTMYGAGGDDYLAGGLKADVLEGGEGSDLLSGWLGSDTLAGGRGSDQLHGDAGDDTYLFQLGDGNDVIRDYSGGKDTLRFAAGIGLADLSFEHLDADLLIHYGNQGDSVRITRQIDSLADQIERIQLADGTQWDLSSLTANVPQVGSDAGLWRWGYERTANWVVCGKGNDYFVAGSSDDHLSGGGGTDTFRGNEGDDWLQGGADDDTLYGGWGSDTYYFELGDGKDLIQERDTKAPDQDVIQFGDGIAPADVSLFRSSRDLVICLGDQTNGAGDKLTVAGQYYISGSDGVARSVVEYLRFADGTVWDLVELGRTAPVLSV